MNILDPEELYIYQYIDRKRKEVCLVCNKEHSSCISLKESLAANRRDRHPLWTILIAASLVGQVLEKIQHKEFCSLDCLNKWVEDNPEKIVIEMARV